MGAMSHEEINLSLFEEVKKLKQEVSEYKQWFERASTNVQEMEKEIERLQAFIENLQVVHFAEVQREKSTVERYEKILKEIAECNEETPFARHIILLARRTVAE